MLLTITNTRTPATDLGYLLHKHPERSRSFPLSFGDAHVFYPEASEARCTAALLLDVDPVGLTSRGRDHALAEYVSDRPYAAGSFLSVAINRVYGTALGGRCEARPELAAEPLPLTATVTGVRLRGEGDGGDLVRRLFEPLGWTVAVARGPLDPRFPGWGPARHGTVTLTGTATVATLLGHLYVLLGALDPAKHYSIGEAEVAKLLRHGEGWLGAHPHRALIADRYLARRRALTRAALERLADDDHPDPDAETEAGDAREERLEQPVSLNEQRLASVLAAVRASGARRVVDLGCGEGKLLAMLAKELDEVAGVDVATRPLERARARLDRLPERVQARVKLMHGSLVYRDRRLAGWDAAVAVEVVEHLDPPRLAAFERAVFAGAAPATVVVTTPNIEYNVRFEGLEPGRLRHTDHRFEWTRAEFRAWAEGVAGRTGYTVRFLPIGPDDPEVGPPTQMGVFSRA
jgi:3' terminal RNA ribose 2'-O-methyltransferase Hen1